MEEARLGVAHPLARSRRTGQRPLRAGLIIASGFAILILIGTVFLMLPWSSADGTSAPLSVALFTSTSAVCVIGLTVVETGTYWSRFGQSVILILIELGGIGFGASATFLFWLIGRNISLRDRMALHVILPGSTRAQVTRTAIYVVGVSLAVQLVGAVVLFFSWRERYPPMEAAFQALFHAVSSFCNAGFDVFGAVGFPGSSLGPERHNPFTILPITLLVLLGGFGFPVIAELTSRRPVSRIFTRLHIDRNSAMRVPLSLNARLVIVAHIGLFVVGVIAIWLLEFDNPSTLKGLPFGHQVLDALNSSAFPRSAGFSTFPLLAFSPTALLLVLLLMFIGTGSAGTGGGVKVNTIAAILASVVATILGRPRPQLFKRTLTQESVNKALVIVVVSMMAIAAATFTLSLTETHIPIELLLFEVVSAFATVGMSLDVTPRLSEAGRVIIEVVMYLGRLGPLTLVLLLSAREQAPAVVYAEEPVLLG